MKTVLILSPDSRFAIADYVNGAAERLKKACYSLHIIDGVSSRSKVASALDFWKPVGCIVQGNEGNVFDRRDFARVPTVFIDHNPDGMRRGDLEVLHDSADVGTLAARELLSLGLANFAFAAYTPEPFWCAVRKKAFVDALRDNGYDCHVSSDSTSLSHAIAKHPSSAAANWLKKLPLPVGILAANDGLAEEILLAAKTLRLSVPDDVAVLGVDNSLIVCEHTEPTLSSIQPDWFHAGQLAADLLCKKLRQPELSGVKLRYGQTGIVRRQSTQRFKVRDKILSTVLETIRKRATAPTFDIDELVRLMTVSRRALELRVRKTLDKSLLDLIHDVRIEQARDLLRRTDKSVREIATASGFPSVTTFFRVFGEKVGMSPREFRLKK